MELRRLQKSLEGYAPSALTAHHMTDPKYSPVHNIDHSQSWWEINDSKANDQDTSSVQMTLVRRRSHAEELEELMTPKGMLLTGPPGSGKSFLVDLWFNGVSTPFKTRKHYNQLVLEIYRAVWEETKIRMASGDATAELPKPRRWSRQLREQWKKLLSTGSLPTKWTRSTNKDFIPFSLSPQQSIAFSVARRLILRHWLLVFDEIQLLDVSSATLLADVLSWFWRMGGIIIGTSNKVPDDLYMNGVQRDRLEPFVEALKVRCPVYVMRSEHDWRQIKAADSGSRSWFTDGQEEAFKAELTQLTTTESLPQTLNVFGRNLYIPWTSGGMCKFTFSQLCEESLGPADYLTLSSHFHTVVITSIPILKLSAKNQARRFISLIDALYESRCRLICLAEAGPMELFFPDAVVSQLNEPQEPPELDALMAEAVADTQTVYRPNVSSYDSPNMADAPEPSPSTTPLESLSIFSGEEEQFAFKRALSRLLEMTSESYSREAQWTPLPDKVRKWEQTSRNGSTLVQPRNEAKGSQCGSKNSDFASEASYEAHGAIGRRPEAPRLRERHIWGMHEEQ